MDFAKLYVALKELYFEQLDISRCSLTIPAQLKILKCCVIKHLIILDDVMCTEEICSCILTEVSKESKTWNFNSFNAFHQ